MPSRYSPQLLVSLQRTITRERLTRYLKATAQSLPEALALYEYNVQLSEVLYCVLHGLEVTVRNAEHLALTTSYGTPLWYDQAPLDLYWRNQVDEAKKRAGTNQRPGKVVAELNFGFWVELAQKTNHWTLWVSPTRKTLAGRSLHKAFPNASLARSVIHQRLKSIQRLRNRISHHEPVLTSSNRLYTGTGLLSLPDVVECIEWVCQDTAQWMKTQFRYADAERILREVAAMKISL